MRDSLLDWRQAVRSLSRAPSFAIVALLTLTVAIALATAVFSLVRTVLLDPVDVPASDRLARLGETTVQRRTLFNGMLNTGTDSGPKLADVTVGVWQGESKTIEAFAPYQTSEVTVITPADSARLTVADVGPQFFDVFPGTPRLGRLLLPVDDEAAAPLVALVSERFWTGRLGRRDDVVGLALTVDRAPVQIVGVLPASFAQPEQDVDIWRPSRIRYPPPGRPRNFSMAMTVVARMRPGVTIAEVRREGQQIVRAIAMANPAFFDGTVEVPEVLAMPMLDAMVAGVKPAMTLLFAGMLTVLLAACVNLASLLLSRNSSRHHEVAVRMALGASRWRVVRPLLFEQLLVGVTGATCGGILGWWTVRLLPRMAPPDLPRLGHLRFDAGSLCVSAAVGLATAVAVGILPAWHIPSPRLREFIGSPQAAVFGRGRSAEAVRSLLVAGQIALAAMLLVGAALIGRSLLALVRVDPGYRPQGVLTFQIGFPDLIWRDKGVLAGYFRELHGRLMAHPGVLAVGHTTILPLRSGGFASTFDIEGRPRPEQMADRPRGQRQSVTPGYLAAIGLRIVRGRSFDEHDTPEGESVVLVNEAFANGFFRGEDPIGHRISIRSRVYARIVGVIPSVHIARLSADAPPAVISLADQESDITGYVGMAAGVAMRVDGDPAAFASIVREETKRLDPRYPVYNLEPLDLQLDRTFSQPRFYAIVLGLFAALAISTAVLGIYGVLAYAVERRRREFGIRRALGAAERHIVLLVVRRAAALAGIGLAIGLGGAAAAARVLRSVLFGVGPADPASYAGAVGLVLVVVVVASWQPVRRALQVDPARALRVD
jgi:putative ABC transport system permease protein